MEDNISRGTVHCVKHVSCLFSCSCVGAVMTLGGGETHCWFIVWQIKVYARKEVMYFLLHSGSCFFFFLQECQTSALDVGNAVTEVKTVFFKLLFVNTIRPCLCLYVHSQNTQHTAGHHPFFISCGHHHISLCCWQMSWMIKSTSQCLSSKQANVFLLPLMLFCVWSRRQLTGESGSEALAVSTYCRNDYNEQVHSLIDSVLIIHLKHSWFTWSHVCHICKMTHQPQFGYPGKKKWK